MHKKVKNDMEQHGSWCYPVGLQGLGIHAVGFSLGGEHIYIYIYTHIYRVSDWGGHR